MAKPVPEPIPDGTEADFRDLLDFACTTPAKPVPDDKLFDASTPTKTVPVVKSPHGM